MHLVIGIKKLVKWTYWGFKENSYVQNGGKRSILCQNSTLFYFSKSVYWIKYDGRHHWVGEKRLFWIFNEKSNYTQNGVTKSFSGPKSTFLKFSLNQFTRFSWNCIWWQVLKSGLKVTGFLREIDVLVKVSCVVFPDSFIARTVVHCPL